MTSIQLFQCRKANSRGLQIAVGAISWVSQEFFQRCRVLQFGAPITMECILQLWQSWLSDFQSVGFKFSFKAEKKTDQRKAWEADGGTPDRLRSWHCRPIGAECNKRIFLACLVTLARCAAAMPAWRATVETVISGSMVCFINASFCSGVQVLRHRESRRYSKELQPQFTAY